MTHINRSNHVELNQERLTTVMSLKLRSGSHTSLERGACIMEAVAYVAGEPWSDSPECACPAVASFLRAWNDGLDAERRQDLKRYIPLLVGSKGSEAIAERRALMAADWLVRTHTVAWLRLAGLNTQADALAGLPEITSMAQVPSIRPAIEAVRSDAYAARAAAWDAAWDAAGDAARAAARDAAWDAARAAAGAAARDAAGDAAWEAAWEAARAAAWDAARAAAEAAARVAAWDAARAAAGAAARAAVKARLKPTQDTLYQSAHALVQRMLEAA